MDDIHMFRSPCIYVRGKDLFGFLNGQVKKAAPFIVRRILPSTLELGENVSSHVSSGESDLTTAVRRRGVEALRGVGQKILPGGGVKRRRRRRRGDVTTKYLRTHPRKRKTSKRKHKEDVFVWL